MTDYEIRQKNVSTQGVYNQHAVVCGRDLRRVIKARWDFKWAFSNGEEKAVRGLRWG